MAQNLNSPQVPLANRLLGNMLATAVPGKGFETFLDNDPIRWIEKNFFIPETPDHHIILGGYQKACLYQALTKGEDGLFPYSLILWSDCKKSIKSTVAAAVALWMAFNTPWGSIKIVANDLKQADSRVSYYIRRAIELNPAMRQVCRVNFSGYFIKLPNNCKIESIPVDPQGEAGGNDDMVIYSELWGAKNAASLKLWTESTLSPMKYGKSFRWVETYAGYSGEAPILEQLYDSGVKNGVQFPWAENFDPPLEAFENKEARIFALWNTTPRLPWQTKSYYAQEESVLTPQEFNRVHRNQWVSSENAFIPIEWWDACYDIPPVLGVDSPVVVSVDAAVTQDCFAVMAVSGRDTDDGIVDVRFSQIWKPPKGGRIDFALPEAAIRSLVEEMNVIEIVYDEYQLADMIGKFSKELLAHSHPFSQQKNRLIADKQLYDMIRERRVHHQGDPDLREHLQNANAQASGNDRMRIVKRSVLLKIDLAVCLSMGVARARYWRI
jgi:phage terminase large subunit-like protein